MNLFQRDNHMVTYSTFRSNRSIDFVFRFPPCSYSRMIPKNKHYEFCFRISLNKQDICKPILNSAVIPQLWCMKLKKDNIWRAVDMIEFVQKWIPPYGMPTQRVFKFQTSATNFCWKIFDENKAKNIKQNCHLTGSWNLIDTKMNPTRWHT